jgi:hypothetical protein
VVSVVSISDARGSGRRRSERVVERLDREQRAVDMSLAGRSYDEIARECGFADRSGAHKAVRRGLARRNQEPLEEQRAVVLARNDLLFRALLPLIERDEPDLRAAELMARVNDQSARLSGLYKTLPSDPESAASDVVSDGKPTWLGLIENVDEVTRTLIKNWARSQYGYEVLFVGHDEIPDELGDGVRVIDRVRATSDDDDHEDDRLVSCVETDLAVDDEEDVDERPSGVWKDGRFIADDPLAGMQPLPAGSDEAGVAAVKRFFGPPPP